MSMVGKRNHPAFEQRIPEHRRVIDGFDFIRTQALSQCYGHRTKKPPHNKITPLHTSPKANAMPWLRPLYSVGMDF